MVADARVVLVLPPDPGDPGATRSVNVIECHFAALSADTEMLLFSFSHTAVDQ